MSHNNKNEHFAIIVIQTLIIIKSFNSIFALTVDNQLVSARNDCFERIALEAMLPFEKTFSTEDTNSLNSCKEKCLQAGEKCQTISFGVHRRGNGTCQLSTEKYNTGGRPSGVIFDPDFDLYVRKMSCFDLSDNTIPTSSADGGLRDGYGGMSPTPPILLTNRPVDAQTQILVLNPTPMTTTQHNDRPTSPATGYGTSHLPEGPLFSTLGPSTTSDGDHLYFSHDIYPLYKYPMLYEPNFPAPNDNIGYIPGGYASNVPEVDDRYRPTYSSDVRPHEPPKPIFGLGYGNGYSYGKPERYNPTTLRPYNPNSPSDYDRDRPSYTTRPGPYSSDLPGRPTRPNYDYSTPPPPTYYPRPDYGPSRIPISNQRPSSPMPPPPSATSPNGHRRPGDFVDYNNRPDPNYSGGSSMRPPPMHSDHTTTGYDYVRRNGSAVQPDGYNDDKSIATYFNPEDYLNGNRKRPNNADRDHVMTTCFRRVLAGKRIAPHWVRRTLACERVEDCMRECGHEKRFMCEGFNYRLDPSGSGQGDCELIEIPLAQIDLYSSTNHRDSNLLRHPDYDYYERDRNAPTSCRKTLCQDCSKGVLSSPPLYFKPPTGGGSGWSGDKPPIRDDHYRPSPPGSGSSSSIYDEDLHHYPRPPPPLLRPSSTAVDRYRPPPPSSYEHHRPPPPSSEYNSNSYEFSSHGSSYFEHTPPSSFGGISTGSGPVDRYDFIRPDDHHYPGSRPDRWQTIPSSSGYDDSSRRYPRPESDHRDHFRPPYRPGSDYSPYRPDPPRDHTGPSRHPESSYHSGPPASPPQRPSHDYLDLDKRPGKFIPYSIGGENNWGSYGGSYGGSSHNKQSSYWGLSDFHGRRDSTDFNYFDLGGSRRRPPQESNSVFNSYPGSSYGDYAGGDDGPPRDRHDYYRHQWTRRPGPDECSAKTSEGFRLHKTAIKHSYTVPTIIECERLCSDQNGFTCHTYSYRYSQPGRENCMLCDRAVNSLDYYVDIEPDRDYDIYSMADDMDVCRRHPARRDNGPPDGSTTALSDPSNTQCFFRAIDSSRFFKSIVRDSLQVRSVGECEMECIKSTKFTCRAFAFRYGQQRHASVIDNCQLSDWPVRDMDKERHLIPDAAFDVFERASYGHGCEIQPIVDEKHKKFCYLGYGSSAKLLPAAIKKVIAVPTELDCKKECIRYRETTSFKCYSFSYGSRASTYNCEMSDLDQTELKLNVHYTHNDDRNYWLFAWNPFDWTCRDKVNTIGGTRVNNDRRMDIFREPGDVTWRHYTVSGKECRRSSPCEKNLVSGFYSCEIESGEVGAWDYCCKADHPCGYSQGFDYAWCFVGDEHDQWRKCSDRYYPANSTNTHSGITVLPPSKHDKKKHSSSPSLIHTIDRDYQHPPRPGGLQSLSDFAAARLWPVTYLYSEGPPNSTEFSNFVDCNKETC